MKVDRNAKGEVFNGEDGATLTVRYANRGEPYREGVDLDLELSDSDLIGPRVFLDAHEGVDLRDALIRIFPL
jgi:hypothetical protein